MMSIFYAIISVISLQPYFVWNNKYAVYAISFLCMVFFFVLIKMSETKVDVKDLLIIIIYVVLIYFNASIDNLKVLFGLLFLQIPIIVYLLGNDELKTNTYKYFVILFAISLIPGMIIFVFNLFGIDFPYTLIKPLNELKGGYYKCYYVAVVYAANVTKYGSILFTRMCGIYDEPGVAGTICGLILIIEKLDIKKSFANKVLLIAGLLSFSMAFYILLLFNILINKKFKLLAFIVVVLTILNFSPFNKQYGLFDKILFDRVKITNFKLSGDNRSSAQLDYAYNRFLKGDMITILTGKGQGYVKDHVDGGGSSSYKILILERGMIFFLLYLFLIALLYYKNTNNLKNYYIYLAILLSIYQRPDVFILAYIVLIVGGTRSNSESDTKTIEGVEKKDNKNILVKQESKLKLTPN